MAKQQGWIKLYRDIQDNWLWKEKPYSKGQAWIDMLLLANHEDKKAQYKGKVVTYQRGTICRSIVSLSSRWGWSRDKTRRFLSALESDGMCVVNPTTDRTTVTIVRYEFYQNTAQPIRQQKSSEPTANRQRADTNKNDIKNDKKNDKEGGASASWQPPPAGTPEYDAWRNQ